MSSQSVRWIHTADDLNILQIDKLKIVIIEAIVGQDLDREQISMKRRSVFEDLPVVRIQSIDSFPIYLISAD